MAQVSEGIGDTCATTSSDHLYCWGTNIDGQLGSHSNTSSETPVEVVGAGGTGALSTVAQVSEGYKATCATTTSGPLLLGTQHIGPAR